MLTPLEIENRKFKKKMSGYCTTEVEEFMSVISENYELIYKENLANKDKINMLTNAVKQYKSMEETLQSAIIVAQSAGDDVVKNAKVRAETIIREAENKASQLLSDASAEVTRISFEYEEMKRNVEVFRTRIISLLNSQLDIIKDFSMPEQRVQRSEVEIKHEKLDFTKLQENSSDPAMTKLKDLERMTKELPKIVQNERGEYVAAEETKDGQEDETAE